MLFQYGDNFRNEKGHFTYHANKNIRSVTLYSTERPSSMDEIAIEYDYTMVTNNAGLVMMEDIDMDKSHYYIVGDSFTEGQGAAPWFYPLEAERNSEDRQLIHCPG